MHLDARQRLIEKIVKRFVREEHYERYPGLATPFLLDDGKVYATDGKAMIVLNQNIIGAAKPAGAIPSVETLLKGFPDGNKSVPLPTPAPTLYETDPCSGCGGSGKCQCDAEDEAECDFPCPHCHGKKVSFTEADESIETLEDGKQKFLFKRSLLHKLDDLGNVTFKLGNKSGSWAGYFFFTEGRAIIVPENDS